MNTIALLLLAIVPHTPVASESVDLIERNWVTSDDGSDLHFVQLLFCDIHQGTGEKIIRDWRIVDLERGEYEGLQYAYPKMPVSRRLVFDDKGTFRDLRVGLLIDTVTNYDVEAVAQKDYPKVWRRPLRSGPVAKSRVRGR